MAKIIWRPGLSIQQDPDAVLNYTVDFIEYLEGDTIASATVTGYSCTATKQAADTTTVTVSVSAVVALASVTIHIDTASGQVENRTLRFAEKEL